MEKKIITSKRFRKNVLNLYDYLLNEHSSKVAFEFLDKLQLCVEQIIQHPEIGKPSQLKANVRSILLIPHNRIYYRLKEDTIELLCLFDMRRKKSPY